MPAGLPDSATGAAYAGQPPLTLLIFQRHRYNYESYRRTPHTAGSDHRRPRSRQSRHQRKQPGPCLQHHRRHGDCPLQHRRRCRRKDRRDDRRRNHQFRRPVAGKMESAAGAIARALHAASLSRFRGGGKDCGEIAPRQLLSITGPTVSARSGTLTLLFRCAFRRTDATLSGEWRLHKDYASQYIVFQHVMKVNMPLLPPSPRLRRTRRS